MIALVSPAASAAISLGLGGVLFAGLRVLVGRIGRIGRIGAGVVAAADALAHVVWALDLGEPWHGHAVAVTMVLAILAASAVLALPAAAAASALARLLVAPRRKAPTRPDPAPPLPATPTPPAAREATPSRRAVVRAAAAAPLAAAVSGAARAFATANAPPEVPTVRVALPDLPDELVGLRILQLTDLHLGFERHAADVDALVSRLLQGGVRPDLVALTGDVAEDPGELEPLFEALRRLDPRLGVAACFGNHEYLGSPDALRRACRRAGADLLVDDGRLVRVGQARLWLGGVDDPRQLHGDLAATLTPGVTRALRGAPPGVPRVLLSHRPDGFLPAAALGASLVLAGHTHGGQIGWGGRSAFEPVLPGRYLWGDYVRGRTALYTSSGFGHWFPFRALCPTEAPVVELARADQSSTRTSRTTSPASKASSGPSARPTQA